MEDRHRRRTPHDTALRRAALAGGLLLVAQGVAAALTHQNSSYAGTAGDALADGLLAAGLLVTLAGIEGLRRRTAARLGALAVIGQTAIVIAIVATMVAGRDILDGVYVAGTVAWIIGEIGIVAGAIRTRQADLRPALALPIASLAALALSDSGGAVLLGLLWIALYATTSRALADRSARHPAAPGTQIANQA